VTEAGSFARAPLGSCGATVGIDPQAPAAALALAVAAAELAAPELAVALAVPVVPEFAVVATLLQAARPSAATAAAAPVTITVRLPPGVRILLNVVDMVLRPIWVRISEGHHILSGTYRIELD
jgi:hypothetical protein